MKLINDFFSIDSCWSPPSEENSDCGFCKRIILNKDHEIYKAHFPGSPITPGVCLVQMATEFLERHFGKQLALRKVVNIKFRKAVTPTESPVFNFFKITEEDGAIKARITIECEDIIFTNMSLVYDIC